MSNRELDPFTISDWGLLGGLALIWGSSFVLIDIGLDNFTPAQVGFLRIALGTVALSLVPVARHGAGGAGVDRSSLAEDRVARGVVDGHPVPAVPACAAVDRLIARRDAERRGPAVGGTGRDDPRKTPSTPWG